MLTCDLCGRPSMEGNRLTMQPPLGKEPAVRECALCKAMDKGAEAGIIPEEQVRRVICGASWCGPNVTPCAVLPKLEVSH